MPLLRRDGGLDLQPRAAILHYRSKIRKKKPPVSFIKRLGYTRVPESAVVFC